MGLDPTSFALRLGDEPVRAIRADLDLFFKPSPTRRSALDSAMKPFLRSATDSSKWYPPAPNGPTRSTTARTSRPSICSTRSASGRSHPGSSANGRPRRWIGDSAAGAVGPEAEVTASPSRHCAATRAAAATARGGSERWWSSSLATRSRTAPIIWIRAARLVEGEREVRGVVVAERLVSPCP
jgi:hypothetical protein